MATAAIDEDVPGEFVCPVTLQPMRDPVLASDGHSYERHVIEHIIDTSAISPMTREPLVPFVFPNLGLRNRIREHATCPQSPTGLDRILTTQYESMCPLPIVRYELNKMLRRDFRRTLNKMLEDAKYVVVREGGVMLMSTFREVYKRYRMDMNLGKPARWCDDVYRTPFAEKGIEVMSHERYIIEGIEHTNVDVIINLALAETD